MNSFPTILILAIQVYKVNKTHFPDNFFTSGKPGCGNSNQCHLLALIVFIFCCNIVFGSIATAGSLIVNQSFLHIQKHTNKDAAATRVGGTSCWFLMNFQKVAVLWCLVAPSPLFSRKLHHGIGGKLLESCMAPTSLFTPTMLHHHTTFLNCHCVFKKYNFAPLCKPTKCPDARGCNVAPSH